MTRPALPGTLAVIAPYLAHYGYAAVGGLPRVDDFGIPVPGGR